jgi:hypothetical protein
MPWTRTTGGPSPVSSQRNSSASSGRRTLRSLITSRNPSRTQDLRSGTPSVSRGGGRSAAARRPGRRAATPRVASSGAAGRSSARRRSRRRRSSARTAACCPAPAATRVRPRPAGAGPHTRARRSTRSACGGRGFCSRAPARAAAGSGRPARRGHPTTGSSNPTQAGLHRSGRRGRDPRLTRSSGASGKRDSPSASMPTGSTGVRRLLQNQGRKGPTRLTRAGGLSSSPCSMKAVCRHHR